MKTTVFAALTNYSTIADALAAKPTNGEAWLLNETQIHGKGTMPSSSNANKSGRQQKLTALRHRIMYYVTDSNAPGGCRPVFDILESDDSANQTRTVTRPGLTRAATRDDDDRRNIKSTQFA